MASSGVDLTVIGDQLIGRIQSDPADAISLMSLSRVLLAKDLDASLATQAMALSLRQLYHLPAAVEAAGQSAGLRLLALMSPGDQTSNTPIEFVLDGSDVALDLLYVSKDLPFPESIPDHDILFVGIGESAESRPVLIELVQRLSTWPRPVINRPERILSMSRDGACELLKGAAGIDMPLSARVSRQTMELIGSGEISISSVLEDGQFPLIVRPIGSHMGHGLARLETTAAVAAHLQASDDSEFYLSRYVDYSGPDGLFRKYRVMLIEGRPFASHLAIADNWIVHYQKAGMEDSIDKRAEEERFMVNFDEDFGQRHKLALDAIHSRAKLDYIGLDCSETRDGRMLIFEVDNAMLVHAMDPVDLFPYKQPAMQKIFTAFRQMLSNHLKDK